MDIITHTFENGFRVVWEKSYNLIPLTSVYVFCDVGSIHEPSDLKGAAHFIEHMCFKGTRKIPLAKDIFNKYDEIGAYFNATTEKQYTEYHVRTQDQYTGHCINIMSDMLLNSIFNKSEFVKEEQVVIEENIKNSDRTTVIIATVSDSLVYRGSNYELPIDTLEYHNKPFEYNKVVKMFKQYYQPSNMILSISSNLPFNDIIKMVKKSNFMKKNEKMVKPYNLCYTKASIQTEIQYKLFEKVDLNTIQLSLSFRTCPNDSPDRYKLNMLKRILSGTLGSRIFLLLRENNGLTYSSSVYTEYLEHIGEFTIFCEMNKLKLIHNNKKKGVLPLIINMVNDLINNGITDKELKRAHTNFVGSELFKHENNGVQAVYNGIELLQNIDKKIVPYSEIYNTYYKHIGKSDIDQVIQTYLKKQNMNVGLVGSNLIKLSIIQSECEKLTR